MSQRRWGRVGVIALAVLAAAAFAYLNGRERVSIHLGVTVLYQVPLVALVFVTWLLGMLSMFLIGLRHDLRVRRVLREYQVQEERQRAWRPETPPEAPPHSPPAPPPGPPSAPPPDGFRDPYEA